MMRRFLPLIAMAVLTPPPTFAEEGRLVASMDEVRFSPSKERGSVELVDGKVGKAVRFRFDAGAPGGFATSNLRGQPDWDHAEGFSFWVKGMGGDGFGGLEFVFDEDYSLRYDYCFPIKGGEWTKIVVAWADLIPVLPNPRAKRLGGPDGNPPSKLGGLWFGRWWYWGDYPALDFAVDEIRLEPTIERLTTAPPIGAPTARTLARLQGGRPITVVTMGDSLTDKRHWANREVAWVDLLRDRLKARYGSDVTIINPAIGGTQLRQNLVLIPRWLEKAPEPDLVTVFFGGNDREAGMTGDQFRAACVDAVDRIRRATHNKADVLTLSTCPGLPTWDHPDGLAGACRVASAESKAGLADVDRAFRSAPDRARLFVDDRVHLARTGHEVVAEAVIGAIEASAP